MKNYKQDWLFRLRSKLIVLVLVSVTIVLCECGSVLFTPAAEDAQRMGTSLNSLKEGRTLYVNNCGSCHALHLPEKYTASEWKDNVNYMRKRAKITDAQKETIYQYLSAGSKK